MSSGKLAESDAFPRRRQFGLAQLMAAVAVVCFLLALLPLALQRTCGYPGHASCMNNLHGLIIAVHNYHDVHNQVVPFSTQPPADSEIYASWIVQLWPYVECGSAYDELSIDGREIDPAASA
jgi:hypothetical protein